MLSAAFDLSLKHLLSYKWDNVHETGNTTIMILRYGQIGQGKQCKPRSHCSCSTVFAIISVTFRQIIQVSMVIIHVLLFIGV